MTHEIAVWYVRGLITLEEVERLIINERYKNLWKTNS